MTWDTDTEHKGKGRQVAATPHAKATEKLTDMQKLFVEAKIMGKGNTIAARMAGYKVPNVEGTQLMQRAHIRKAIEFGQKQAAKVSDMSRKKVMDGFLEAIDMAKLQGESGVMVAGWREVAKMCGYYAPEKKQIDVNVSAKRMIGQLETMSEAELLEMIENDSSVIEGEAEEILDSHDYVDAVDEETDPLLTQHDFSTNDVPDSDLDAEYDAEMHDHPE